MTATRSGIPTTYRYSNMRSRLEARWAAFFDLVGWSWVYEPLDARGWIPDFLIEGQRPFLVEVGACISEADFIAKSRKADPEPGLDVLILGVSPQPNLHRDHDAYSAAGWLGEGYMGLAEDGQCSCAGDPTHPAADCANGVAGFEWGPAIWGYTTGHRMVDEGLNLWAPQDLSVFHDTMGWDHRPGPGHQNPYPDQDCIRELWAEAGNRVQWKPR